MENLPGTGVLSRVLDAIRRAENYLGGRPAGGRGAKGRSKIHDAFRGRKFRVFLPNKNVDRKWPESLPRPVRRALYRGLQPTKFDMPIRAVRLLVSSTQAHCWASGVTFDAAIEQIVDHVGTAHRFRPWLQQQLRRIKWPQATERKGAA